MSKLGEWIAWQINRRFPTLPIHQGLTAAKLDIQSNQDWAYNEAERIIFAFDPYWDLAGKHILDIGVGLGGKLRFYVKAGAKKITGVDINLTSLWVAQEYLSKSGIDNVHLTTLDAGIMPFPDDSFDAIVSINVFEHIKNLEDSIRETYRVVKPGGLIYFHLPPYFSPWGPHLESWIHFPWPHLLFSDRTLMRVAAREDARLGINNQFVQAAQIDWEANKNHIPDVNRVTIRQFQKMIRSTGFKVLQLKLLPVGYELSRQNRSFLQNSLLRLIHTGAQIPVLQEVLVTKMVYVLQK
jgi:ubiquinone/menaquinone biosynthesis C-methylase UbiE